MIQDRWQADEDFSSAGDKTLEVIEPPCMSCKKRFENDLSSCEEYESIPWEICVADEKCSFYEKIEG